MKERPILFSGAMVRAILAWRKTQTRRIVASRPMNVWGYGVIDNPSLRMAHGRMAAHVQARDGDGFLKERWVLCPYGEPGGRLWVRETWAYETDFGTATGRAVYRADGDTIEIEAGKPTDKWRPSIHMPRRASRLTLEVVAVRVERVQDITEADALAEGVERRDGGYKTDSTPGAYGRSTAKRAYEDLWDSINSARGYGWASNPWVWVIEFRRVRS